jgi:hypothetical protein
MCDTHQADHAFGGVLDLWTISKGFLESSEFVQRCIPLTTRVDYIEQVNQWSIVPIVLIAYCSNNRGRYGHVA